MQRREACKCSRADALKAPCRVGHGAAGRNRPVAEPEHRHFRVRERMPGLLYTRGRCANGAYLIAAHMLERKTSASWRDYLAYLKGGDPIDTWEFRAGALAGRITNSWRAGLTVLVDDRAIAHRNERVAVRGTAPFLSCSAVDSLGAEHRIEVFVRAVFSVKIRVSIDGVASSPVFV